LQNDPALPLFKHEPAYLTQNAGSSPLRLIRTSSKVPIDCEVQYWLKIIHLGRKLDASLLMFTVHIADIALGHDGIAHA